VVNCLNLLKECEKKLDSFNYEFGKVTRPCLYCYALSFIGQEGVIHKEDCLILRLREAIKNEQ